MKAKFTGRSLLLAPCTALLLSSCNLLPEPQVDTTRYFTLSEPAATTAAPAAAESPLVRPVRLAGHLRNRSMAVRISANEVIYLEDVLWAEPLDEAVTQLLRNRLHQVKGEGSVTVLLQRCELVRSAGNHVELIATFTLTPSVGGGEPRIRSFSATPRPWDGKDPGDLVGLLREAVAELAEAVAAAYEK